MGYHLDSSISQPFYSIEIYSIFVASANIPNRIPMYSLKPKFYSYRFDLIHLSQ